MLAISFALAIALHGEPFVQGATSVGPLAGIGHEVQGPVLLPYGQGLGSYAIAQGKLVALLEDASGVPLWALDAEVDENGEIDGDLLPLRYATNPALGGGMLSVSGQMMLDEDGNGSFFATAFQYVGGAVPVFPVAWIKGLVKQAPLGHQKPHDAGGRSRLIAAMTDPDVIGPQVVRSGVIVCPAGFYQPESFALQSVRKPNQGGFAQKKNGPGAILIVDPAVATVAGSAGIGAASVGAKRERAAAGHELQIGPGLASVKLSWWLLN